MLRVKLGARKWRGSRKWMRRRRRRRRRGADQIDWETV
jgi:hypothetical protein